MKKSVESSVVLNSWDKPARFLKPGRFENLKNPLNPSIRCPQFSTTDRGIERIGAVALLGVKR
jgi:hypothetical protein